MPVGAAFNIQRLTGTARLKVELVNKFKANLKHVLTSKYVVKHWGSRVD